MIKAIINNETKRTAFAKAGGKKITGGFCSTQTTFRGLVLNNYKVIASGVCFERKNILDINNVVAFKKQKEVA